MCNEQAASSSEKPSCRPALLAQQRANADGNGTDGARDTHDGYTARPAARPLQLAQDEDGPLGRWHGRLGPTRAGHSVAAVVVAFARSRDPGASPRRDCGRRYREQGRDVNAPRRCCEHASSIALPQPSRHTKPCLHAAMPSWHQCNSGAVQLCSLLYRDMLADMQPGRPPLPLPLHTYWSKEFRAGNFASSLSVSLFLSTIDHGQIFFL